MMKLGVSQRSQSKKQVQTKKNFNLFAYPMITPFVLFFFVTVLLPAIASLAFSFMQISDTFTFVGFENFKSIFKDPLFFKSYGNTFILMLGSIPVTIMMALVFAVLLNQPSIKGRGFFKTVYYLPSVTSIVAVSSIFLTFYNPTGLINNVLGGFGIQAIPWLSSAVWSRIAVIIVSVWLNVGYYTVLFLAGLQNVSKEIYESAEVDGASKTRQFFSITIPLLRPVVLMATLLATLGGLGTFEAPNILFKNTFGPDQSVVTVGVNLYKTSFELVDFGKASAISWTMVVIAVVIAIIQFKVGGKDVDK